MGWWKLKNGKKELEVWKEKEITEIDLEHIKEELEKGYIEGELSDGD